MTSKDDKVKRHKHEWNTLHITYSLDPNEQVKVEICETCKTVRVHYKQGNIKKYVRRPKR